MQLIGKMGQAGYFKFRRPSNAINILGAYVAASGMLVAIVVDLGRLLILA